MCAINGFNFEDRELLSRMNAATKHRGPDGDGVFFESNVLSLGHNRLSIIDRSDAGHQPMKSRDGNLVIAFNGEVYNFQELRQELSSYPYRSKTDTEVILAAYEKWGRKCVTRLNGIFAFAIWDRAKGELFLARDPVGVKPLYYFHHESQFIFSSEAKAILEHPVPRVLNEDAFSHYMRALFVPGPITAFRGILKLPPGHTALLKNGTLTLSRYFFPAHIPAVTMGRRELAETVRGTVLKSVRRELISDRPLGVYLSGGIDSSAVLDSVSRARNAVETFTVGFDLPPEQEREKFNADLLLARATARHYGTNHHEILFTPEEVPELLLRAVRHLDEPVSNATVITQLRLAQFAKERVDVVLGGDGGDELFGGYERYRLSRVMSAYERVPQFFRRPMERFEKFRKLNTPSGIERYALFMFQKEEVLKRVLAQEFINQRTHEFYDKNYFTERENEDFTDVFMDADRETWLVDESLIRSDKMSMAAGLEERVPLLNRELVELALRIPPRYKVGLFDTKRILKDAFRGRIPDFLYGQPKRGWFSPAAKWLRHRQVYALAEDVLSAEYYGETAGLFHWEEVRRILEDHRDKKEYNLTIIWAILSFQLWAREFRVKVS